jgi:hypothetical protein
LLHYFYGCRGSRFRSFTAGGLILIRMMSNIFHGVRGMSLTLLILAAIGHADFHGGITGSGLPVSGLGRLGRDLVRRESGDAAASVSDRGWHQAP